MYIHRNNGFNRYDGCWRCSQCSHFHWRQLSCKIFIRRHGKAALDEKIRHDKALEAYQGAYAKWQKDRTELLDWIAEQDCVKDKARHDFQDTDRALALYNQTHRAKVALPKEPQFSDFYKPSQQQKNGKLLFIGASTIALGFAAFRFPLKTHNIFMDAKLSKIYYSPKGYWKGLAAVKKLAAAAKVAEDVAKRWLTKQALWQIYLPTPRYIPRPKFDVFSPNAVHQADLLLFCLVTNSLMEERFTKTL